MPPIGRHFALCRHREETLQFIRPKRTLDRPPYVGHSSLSPILHPSAAPPSKKSSELKPRNRGHLMLGADGCRRSYGNRGSAAAASTRSSSLPCPVVWCAPALRAMESRRASLSASSHRQGCFVRPSLELLNSFVFLPALTPRFEDHLHALITQDTGRPTQAISLSNTSTLRV